MSETKHTAGPWQASYSKQRDNYQIWSQNRHWIANTKCESTPRDHAANAHLIAAAPELLEALKLVVTRCGPMSHDGKIANAAIAKAEGRS